MQDILNRIYSDPHYEDIVSALLSEGGQMQELFVFADRVRKQYMGDGVLLRGIVEFSNVCENSCAYCGLNKYNTGLVRYTLTADELLKSVAHIASCGIKTVVLQSGETTQLDTGRLRELIVEIKRRFDMAITISVGERAASAYKSWREAGADRYLLKIETTDKGLYETLHPGMSFENRVRCLDELKALGYQVGSGIIVGLKGQSPELLARDILFFKCRDFDMIGIGPFIPHQATVLSRERKGDLWMTLKAVAVTRIVMHTAHLPATTALGSMEEDFRTLGLKAGANVLMPNFTPQPYRKLYEIYPGKRCIDEPAGACPGCMEGMAVSIGRHIDYSRGDSIDYYTVI